MVRSILFRFVVAAAFFAIVEIASAMSALEFLRAQTDNKEAPVMKEIVIKLVTKGYKNVPDWARLSALTRSKILEKGYTSQDIEAIAEEAALAAGMTR
jgi:SpoVK/Ycf46/Vps4 family AAA+-type ATPase